MQWRCLPSDHPLPPAPTAVATLTDSTAVQQQQLLNSSGFVHPQQQHCLNSPLRPPQQVPSHPAASYANHSQSSQQTQFSDRHTPGGFFVHHHLWLQLCQDIFSFLPPIKTLWLRLWHFILVQHPGSSSFALSFLCLHNIFQIILAYHFPYIVN